MSGLVVNFLSKREAVRKLTLSGVLTVIGKESNMSVHTAILYPAYANEERNWLKYARPSSTSLFRIESNMPYKSARVA